ncbi:MAG TPA: TonB-dependent receptor plug domain-containing protein [Sphingomicrobium sp.]|nr:TonB-dependent receptor plug domain-containing protein [Sphingomicrobium sp.]
MSRGGQRLGAAVHWLVVLFVLGHVTPSRLVAASPDQPKQAPLPNDKRASALSLAVVPPTLLQHDAGPQIVITGSRIPRTDLTAVSPVTTVGGEEFKLAGATNVEELLNQLPQVNPSQGEFVSAGATGAATVDLRGLGSVRTLVLIDGHRVMPGDPRYPAPDINIIPVPLVRRVEVLTGGSAAVYGSDAVAGVVNFILDTHFVGFKAEGQFGGYQHNNRDEFARALLDRKQLPYPRGSVLDGGREYVSVEFGRGFLDGRAHVSVYGGYRDIDAVTQKQRDYGACPITAKNIPASILECGGPLVSYPGNYFDNLGNAYQVTPERTFVPGITRFNYAPWNFY